MMKKMLCMLLALIMVVSLIGCGTTTQETTKETQAAQTQADQTAAQETEEPEDIVELTMVLWSLNSTALPSETELVEEAINEITREKIGAEIKIMVLESGNYDQQINLMLAGSESFDLMVTRPGGPLHFNSMVSQKQVVDITDLLPEYAPELLANLPDRWIDATVVDGRSYGVTSMGDKVNPLSFVCRKDIVDQTGIDVSTIKDAKDLEALLVAALEVAPEIVPLASGTKPLGQPYMINENNEFVLYDGLGDGDNAIIGIMDGEGTTITNNYERADFVYMSKLFKDWYDKGLIYKDAVTTSEPARSFVAQNVAFGYFATLGTGALVTESTYCGHEMISIPLAGALLGTSKLRQFTWVVPVTSEDPEKAVAFLNLMYSDADVLNLLTWGIEGQHYQTLADGTIDFLDGENPDTCKYYIGDITSIIGNGYLAKVRKGQDPNQRATALEINQATAVSEFLGFGFDTTGLENEIAQITNTIAEYRPALNCGFYTDEYYDEFMQKMRDNGVDKFVTTVQEQLDAFLAK